MNTLQHVINAVILSISVAVAAPTAIAQEVAYGVTDKQRLQNILLDAKMHLASEKNNLQWLKAAGIASHQLASLKVSGASDDAVIYLRKATELEPEDAELLAYLGSAYAMAGRDSGFLVNRISHVNRGLAALDKAVKKDPNNLNVRFIRGSVSYSLPPMFSRKATAVSDYLFFVSEAKTRVQVNPDRLSEAYYKLGQLSEERDQKSAALDFYAQAQTASPKSDWAKQAGRAMK